MLEPKLTYGLDKDDVLRHIDVVGNGLSCGCICPQCHGMLSAVNNPHIKRQHHFRHYKCPECVGARMTVLHRLAQEVLFEQKQLELPPFDDIYYSQPAQLISFDEIKVEYTYTQGNDYRRADCLAIKDGHELWIEILVSHKVDADKTKFLKTYEQSCVEVDLTSLLKKEDFSKETISYFLQHSARYAQWISCPVCERKSAKQRAQDEENCRKNEQKQKENAKLRKIEFERRLQMLATRSAQNKASQTTISPQKWKCIEYEPYDENEQRRLLQFYHGENTCPYEHKSRLEQYWVAERSAWGKSQQISRIDYDNLYALYKEHNPKFCDIWSIIDQQLHYIRELIMAIGIILAFKSLYPNESFDMHFYYGKH